MENAGAAAVTMETNPHQNIADAWQVMEKLLTQFFLFELSIDENGWWANFKQVGKTCNRLDKTRQLPSNIF